MSNNEIKHKFALDENSNFISIGDAKKRDNSNYTCICCNEKLITKIGQGIRQPHFSHVNNGNSCSNESYLHQLGKLMFFSEYNKCLEKGTPFFLEIPATRKCTSLFNSSNKIFPLHVKLQNGDLILKDIKSKNKTECSFSQLNHRIDLTTYFSNKAQLEVNDGEFRPDVLLTSPKGDKLYFEVFVTHYTDEKKNNSGVRIVEFNMNNIDNLKDLVEHKIMARNCVLFNFKNYTSENICYVCDKYLFFVNPSSTVDGLFEADLDNKSTVADYINSNCNTSFIHKDALGNSIQEFSQIISKEFKIKNFLSR